MRITNRQFCKGPETGEFIRFEPLAEGESFKPSAWLWLHVGTGLDELCALYKGRGVTIAQEPEDLPWGGGVRQFILKDCNGYLISFCQELDSEDQ